MFLAPSIKGRDGMENQIVMLVHGIGQGYLMVGGEAEIHILSCTMSQTLKQ